MLTRTTAGLLFSDDFNRADGAIGANYTVASGTWVISGNRLKHTILRNALSNMRLTAGVIAARAKMHVQAQITRDDLRSFLQVTTRGDANNFYYHDHAASDAGGGQASSSRVNRWAGGGTTNVNIAFVAGPAGAAGVAERITAFTDVGVQKTWINGASLVTTNDTTAANAINGTVGFMSFGQTSLGGNVFGYIDDLLVCADRTISVNGLPAGYKIRANGLTSAAAVAATTLVLDLLGTLLPVTLLEVLDGSGTVVDSTAINVYGGDVFDYVSAATLRASSLVLPLSLAARMATGDVLRAPLLTLPLSLVGRMTSGRVLKASSLVLPISLAARLGVSRYLVAPSLALPVRLAGRMTERDRWLRTDIDPASNWTSARSSTRSDIGLGPVAGLPRSNVILTPNVSGVYDGIRVSYDAVVVNPAGYGNTTGETIQQYTGTGPAGVSALVVRFDRPIREFGVTQQQMTYYGGYMAAYDANDIEIARVLFDLVAWQDHGSSVNNQNPTLAQTIDVGANLIRTIRLYADPADWSAWSDLHFTRDGIASNWLEGDLAPATVWN